MTKPRVRREEALVKSVHAMDTSRRVGWGKFYAEAEKVDDLSRDLNMARSDFDLMSRFAGYLYGAMTVAAPEVVSRLPEEVDRLGILAFLPRGSIRSGRAVFRSRRDKRRRTHVDGKDAVAIAYELMLDGGESPPDPNGRPTWDPVVGPSYRVDDGGRITARATASGGVRMVRSKSSGKTSHSFYLTEPERERLLKILTAIDLVQKGTDGSLSCEPPE